ncbi:MAG: glycosyltransferase family 4 protein [Vicinamibacterales bacterium]
MSTIVAYPASPGHGGLGHHSEQVLQALVGAGLDPVEAFGPAPADRARFPGVDFTAPPTFMPGWYRRYTPYRYDTGRYQFTGDRRFGRWLGAQLTARPFTHGYLLTQVAEETLRLARVRGARSILDSPTGHIRHYQQMLERESRRWVGWPYIGHPNARMVNRVEAEYQLADRIRVSSRWSLATLVDGGIDPRKVFVAPQQVDITRFAPPSARPAPSGPLRIAFVGSFSLAKGFPYLLEAVRRVGPQHVVVEMVGATGDLWSRRLFARLADGLHVVHAPGHPLEALRRADLFVFPTLHDGFGLAVAEALACGLPVITTDCCGAAEWMVGEDAGWIVPAGELDPLADTLRAALDDRVRLREMGERARGVAERLSAPEHRGALAREIAACWAPDAARRVS